MELSPPGSWRTAAAAGAAAVRGIAGGYEGAGRAGFATTLRNAAGDLFTFMAYPGLDPTNNACERAVREVVRQRNVRQKLVTAGGRENFDTLMTCLLTWKKLGLPAPSKMRELLGAAPPGEYARIAASGARAGIGGRAPGRAPRPGADRPAGAASPFPG